MSLLPVSSIEAMMSQIFDFFICVLSTYDVVPGFDPVSPYKAHSLSTSPHHFQPRRKAGSFIPNITRVLPESQPYCTVPITDSPPFPADPQSRIIFLPASIRENFVIFLYKSHSTTSSRCLKRDSSRCSPSTPREVIWMKTELFGIDVCGDLS